MWRRSIRRAFRFRSSSRCNGLDRTTCLDAIATARRLEGEVVVELLDYAAPADCRDDNDMTWRFMP